VLPPLWGASLRRAPARRAPAWRASARWAPARRADAGPPSVLWPVAVPTCARFLFFNDFFCRCVTSTISVVPVPTAGLSITLVSFLK
jgi:hypothetical protein